ERDSRRCARARERGILRQEAIARMNSVAPGLLRGADNLVDREIALARRRWADSVSLVGQAHVQRGAIGITEHNCRPNAHFLASARDAHGNLATICDQYLSEHA